MKRFAPLALMLLLSGCSLITPAPESVELEVRKQGPWQEQDQVLWQQQGNELLLEIQSPAGVGSARLIPRAGGWPESVSVRLHLTALEGFLATTGSERFEYQLPQQENSQRAQDRAKGAKLEAVEFELPEALFNDPSAPLIIQWVDFYR